MRINSDYHKILHSQILAYVTKKMYLKIFKITDDTDFPRKIQWRKHQTMLVYDCTSYSQQLKRNIKHDTKLIRVLNSKSSTDKLSYGDIIRKPGTQNYIEKFHYVHILSPEDKYKVQTATERIKKYYSTYKLTPNLSPTAPVYLVPNRTELWKNKLIFKDDLAKRIQVWLKSK